MPIPGFTGLPLSPNHLCRCTHISPLHCPLSNYHDAQRGLFKQPGDRQVGGRGEGGCLVKGRCTEVGFFLPQQPLGRPHKATGWRLFSWPSSGSGAHFLSGPRGVEACQVLLLSLGEDECCSSKLLRKSNRLTLDFTHPLPCWNGLPYTVFNSLRERERERSLSVHFFEKKN